jgi:hypothetical protein
MQKKKILLGLVSTKRVCDFGPIYEGNGQQIVGGRGEIVV